MTRRIFVALCLLLPTLPVLGAVRDGAGVGPASTVVLALKVPPDQLGGLRVHRWRPGVDVPEVQQFGPRDYLVGDEVRLPVPCRPGDRVVVHSDRFVSEPVTVDADGCDGTVRRPRVFLAGQAYGRLSGDSGTPLPKRFDVDVVRCQGGAFAGGADTVGLFPVSLARDGSWTATLPADCLDATVRVERYPPYQLSRVRVPLAGAVSWGHITLSRYASLSLEVRSSDASRPVEGARACVLDPEAFAQEAVSLLRRDAPRGGICGRTDSSGHVTLSRIPPGLAHLTIDAGGFAPVVGEPYVMAPGERTTATVMLPTFADLRISVVEPTKKPSHPLEVRMEPYLAGRPASQAAVVAVVDDLGLVEFHGLTPGRWHVELLKTGENLLTSVLQEQLVDLRSGESRELRFDPDRDTYRGRVLANGRPVVGSVRVQRVSVSGAIVRTTETTSDRDGRFEVVLSEPGAYNVSVQSWDRTLGGAVPRCRFDNPGETVVINLPTSMIVATVVNGTGEPARSVRVDAVPTTLSREVRAELPAVSLRGITDEGGVARITGLADGPWVVRAAEGSRRSEASEVLVGGGLPQSVQLVLRDAVQARGRVLSSAGEPLVGVAGYLYFESSAGPGGSGVGSFTTNARGEFAATVDPPSAALVNIQLFHSLGIAAFRVPVSDALNLRLPSQVGSAVISFTGGSVDDVPNPYYCYLVNDSGAMVGVPMAAAHGLAFGATRGFDSVLVLPRLAPGRWRVLRIEYGTSPPLFLFSDPARTRWNGEFVVAPGRRTLATSNAALR